MDEYVYKKIISEKPYKELWKQLRFLLDKNLVIDKIVKEHKIKNEAIDKIKNNLKKQADQISYCIIQAEEYFKAANEVSIATKPVLVYYGAVSLSKALILIKQDGNYSFDALRENKKHKHHGLEFSDKYECLSKKNITVIDFFKSLECNIFLKNNNEPWGNFPLFYKSLNNDLIKGDVNISYDSSSYTAKVTNVINSFDKKDLNFYINKRFNSFELMSYLPDLYHILRQFNYEVSLFTGNHYKDMLNHMNINSDDVLKKRKITFVDQFFIKIENESKKNNLFEYYKSKSNNIKINNLEHDTYHLMIRNQFYEGDELNFYYPDIIDDINGTHFFIYNSENYICETASMLILLFLFSMISRYHPDIWINAINTNIRIYEIIDSFLNIVIRKFPNRILDQIWNMKFNFSTK